MKKIVCYIIILSLNLTYVYGQTKQALLQKYFSTLAANGQFNGNILAAENGKVIYEGSFGHADFESGILNQKNTPFPIASISKTFTATAILQLAQNGKLKLSHPVKRHLPWFPYKSVTIRHLLSHTSGLPPYNAFFDSLRKKQPERIFTNADFKDGVVSNPKPLLYQPGEKGNYDNVNFVVLALLIESVSGTSYTDYIASHVLQPADMTETRLIPFRVQYIDSFNTSVARPYLYPHLYSDSMVRASRVPYIVSYWTTYNFSGFGDFVSTVQDLLKYDKAYYNGKLLSTSMLEQAFIPVKLNNGKYNSANFGLGWEVWPDTSFGKVVYHNGNATGLSCILVRNISRHQTIVIFDNIHNNNSQELAFKALKMLNGIEVRLPKKSIAAEYARTLLSEGPEAAKERVMLHKMDTVNYQLSEDEMNLIGYDFLGGPNNPNPYHFPEEHKHMEAIETFKLNMELFPNSWNVYDSYGEALLIVGRKDDAIKMYKKSIELNPKNEGGKKVLEQLSK